MCRTSDLASLRRRGLTRCRVGIRPHALTPAGDEEIAVVPIKAVHTYAIGRERFVDFDLSGQIWKGVVPPDAPEAAPSRMHLDPAKIFYFTPDGVRVPTV